MGTDELPEVASLGELGDLLRVQSWRIARLFETGVVDDVPRVGGRRVIPRARIEDIRKALLAKGWLS